MNELLGKIRAICSASSDRSWDTATQSYVENSAIVAYPKAIWHVQDLLKLAARLDFTIVPRGMGSARSGGALALHDPQRTPVVLDLTSHAEVFVDVNKRYLVAGCGASNIDIRDAAQEQGLYYPIDVLSPYSTIGGNIAVDAVGVHGLAYGSTGDYVQNLHVIMHDGSRLVTASKAAKAAMGLDLTKLFVGSEGTIGIIWDATLRLLSTPPPMRTYVLTFDGHDTAVATGLKILRRSNNLAAMEFLDSDVSAFLRGSEYSSDYKDRYVLLIHAFGDTSPVDVPALSTRDAGMIWKTYQQLAYEDILGVVVEPSDTELLVYYVHEVARQAGGYASIWGSLGMGRYSILFRGISKEATVECRTRVEDYVLTVFDGSLAYEGLGYKRTDLFVASRTDAARVNLALKNTFDPLHILNPRKLI